MITLTLPPPRRWGPIRKTFNMLLLVSLTFGTVTVPEAWAADYYVDTGGSDGSAGSSGAPWKHLTYALTQATSGDVIHVAAGTYDTPGNGETFPLALKDGVAIIGDPTDPTTRTISAPAATDVFFNDGSSPLSSTTRLAGFTLTHDANDDSNIVLDFAVVDQTLQPQIDHNLFLSNSSYDEIGVYAYDDSSAAGTLTATIDNNTFTDMWAPIWVEVSGYGGADTYSPTITNNTFTGCDYPVNYTMSSSAEGTVGGLVQGNTFRTTSDDDIHIYFEPQYYVGSGLLFNPTITGNDMGSGASENVYAYIYGYSYSGNADFSPTITNNTMSATGYNVEIAGYYYDIYGDYTVAPTISGNTMTGASSDAVSLSLSTMSVSSSSNTITVSPTITDNIITSPGGYGVNLYLYYPEYGQFAANATISGNTITNPARDGIYIELSEFSYIAGINANWTISNNTITSPGGDGISFSMEYMSFSGSGTFNLTVDGNTVTGSTYDGIGLYPAYSWYSYNQVDETVLVRGNTVTGSTYDGLYVYFSDQTSNTLDARITDNVLQNNGRNGLVVQSWDLGSNGIRVECNTITGNGGNGIDQESTNDPPADFGGGNLSAVGNNTLYGNGTITGTDFYNGNSTTASAENNWWGDNDPSDQVVGPVDYTPWLTSAPTVTLGAELVDVVANDVLPTGASIGDTIQYTATIAGGASEACGNSGVVFTAPIPANATVVAGSVTTSKGNVTGEDPVTVNIGTLASGETVTITWQVIPASGTQISTQASVEAGKSGTTLSDDPSTAPPDDPTVTVFQQQQGGEAIPTLNQWGLIAFAGLLLLLGVGLLRRRRYTAAGLVVILALGAAWAGAATRRHVGGKVAKKEVTVTASKVEKTAAVGKTVTLTLADGSTVTLPRHALKVRDVRRRPDRPHLEGLSKADRLIALTKLRAEHKAMRAEHKAQVQALTAGQRAQQNQQRRLERRKEKAAESAARRDPLALLAKGTPVTVRLVRDKNGRITRALVQVYPTEVQAHAEVQRQLARKEQHQAKRLQH
jgi:hypothetical protein